MSHGTKRRWHIESLPIVGSAEAGLARQQVLADQLTSQSEMPFLLVWRCQRALLVSRSEARLPRFESASVNLQQAGWPLLLRKSGGQACPVGPGTVQAAMIEVASQGATMNAKYSVLAELVQTMLRSYQIVPQTGLVSGAYCPGSYDLGVNGRKIAGMSQHWFRNCSGIHCILTAASINVEEPPDLLAGVVNRFYCNAGSPLRCQAAVLTNMRRSGASHLAEQDLATTVMDQFRSIAKMLGEMASQNIHCVAR